MVKASELRIGCWVDDAGMNAVMISEIPAKIPLYYPIKLTPQILEKCGFEFNGGYFIIPLKNSLYGIDKIKVGKGIFLHQLQNLYFALTGEELDINL
jgi:hypothetical protein